MSHFRPRALGVIALRLIPAAIAVVMLAAPSAHAELATHLDIIGWDEIEADARFSDLVIDGGLGQSIAVFDTGVDASHTLFSGRGVTGANFAANPASPVWSDVNGHGTFVASVTAGNGATTTGGTELGGIARGADLVSVRVLDDTGTGGFGGIVQGLDNVIDQIDNHGSDIRVINMSLGTTSTFITEPTGGVIDDFNARVEALANRGVAVVAASGNSGSQTGLSFPAISDMVFAVGSSDENDSVSSFTNRNNELDLLAPGENVIGAFQDANNDSLLSTGSGTSFAAPQMSGALVLIHEVFEDRWGRRATVEELFDIATTSAVTVMDSGEAFPRLDLFSALDRAYTIPEPATIWLFALAALLVSRRQPRRG